MGNEAAVEQSKRERFSIWMDEVQDRLRFALIAGHGAEAGTEAAADALAYAWEHWDNIEAMENPAGYVYRVGDRMARHDRTRRFRRPLVFPELNSHLPHVEPGLPLALASLSKHQRVAIALVYGLGYSYQEVAGMLDVSKGTVQTHVQRGMAKLRHELGVQIDA
jgi:RNA polymerase sigma-70 factor (ECF subfamily)